MKILLLLAAFAALVNASSAPALVMSHKLVRGLTLEIEKPFTKTQDPQNVNNMIKKLVTECSSDIYLLVNIPGLANSDMLDTKEQDWPHLIKYIHMASSVVGLPWVEGPLDLQYLEKYIVKTCKAEAVNVFYSEDEVAQYIDTRKRVVRVDMNPLPQNKEQRVEAIKQSDDLIRKILRKAPSPHYTIIILLSEVSPVHPIPQIMLDESPEMFEIFYSLLHSPLREQEVERNNYMYSEVEPFWNERGDPMKIYLDRRKRDEVHFFNYELWKKNEKLVSTIALMVISLFVVKALSFGLWLASKFKKTHQD